MELKSNHRGGDDAACGGAGLGLARSEYTDGDFAGMERGGFVWYGGNRRKASGTADIFCAVMAYTDRILGQRRRDSNYCQLSVAFDDGNCGNASSKAFSSVTKVSAMGICAVSTVCCLCGKYGIDGSCSIGSLFGVWDVFVGTKEKTLTVLCNNAVDCCSQKHTDFFAN